MTKVKIFKTESLLIVFISVDFLNSLDDLFQDELLEIFVQGKQLTPLWGRTFNRVGNDYPSINFKALAGEGSYRCEVSVLGANPTKTSKRIRNLVDFLSDQIDDTQPKGIEQLV